MGELSHGDTPAGVCIGSNPGAPLATQRQDLKQASHKQASHFPGPRKRMLLGADITPIGHPLAS
jgi:hypothetical protein